ncbi:MAG: hypothetical protein LM580_11055 [Thermofilum sp.]|jgi:hypothetical protein|nr:hypothetical protein [Thermofilum sp.]MCC6065593.1 hypothetical protein [Thermofilum sp.]
MSKPEETKEGSKAPAVTVKTPEEREVEELREVLRAVSDFLKELSPTIKELIDTVLGSLRGDALGKEVGMFYKSLIEAGIKEETATKMAEEFLRRKMEMVNVAEILPTLSQMAPRKQVEVVEKKTSEEKTGEEKSG